MWKQPYLNKRKKPQTHLKKPALKGSENRWSIYILELQKINVIFRE
jgi:hypothetical protein